MSKLKHLVFWCSNLSRVRKFYEEILGFEVHNVDPNGRWVSYKNEANDTVFRFAFMQGAPEGRDYRGLARSPSNPDDGDNWEPFFTVTVEDLRTVWEKLKAAGFRTRYEHVHEDETSVTGRTQLVTRYSCPNPKNLNSELVKLMFTNIRALAIYVTDLQRAKRFYTDVLGFELSANLGPNLCFLKSKSGNVYIYMEGGKKQSAVDNQTVRLSFFLQSEKTASEIHASLKAAGVKLLQEAPGLVGNETACFQLEDPDGNIIEVCGKP